MIGVQQTTLNVIPNPNTNANVTVRNIEFHANMISLGPEVMSMIHLPEYMIYSESYYNFQQCYANAFSQLQPLNYSITIQFVENCICWIL